ncbi:YbhB/YbcL family Raf kinase inhibitor-like protein [Parvularcula dongshanensis]|uniref:Raf kinase inhibitor-like YbhB/YbcL family protein n=1 Tax=Parvularcula dongshanensis TaxID=1173995 RepID=A0A840I5K4_9PROT|nr:YbhB/YbcL family Raf kinase inhibitor-like protein [Parvularcula dongshanensis]MBB4659300.1 Raf kinase inhibitor-like YbhB/YbcL family protein [Parvularcula dongshanensis]
MTRSALLAALAATAAWPAFAAAQQDTVRGLDREQPVPKVSEQLKDQKTADVTVVGHVLKPKSVEPSAKGMERLALPEGFTIDVFAEDLVNPRMIRVADDGTVYVTRREVGDVLMLRDEDGDGKADSQKVVASRPMMHGIEIDGDDVYLMTVSELFHATRNEDGTFGELERLIDDLPEGGQHANRMVVRGGDGNLYVSVGSTCNACDETNPENATILQVKPDGSSRKIYASGLRNTIGYGFSPDTGELYGFDHGIDWLGDDEQPEEINKIEEGAKYGWPYVYGDQMTNPQDEPSGGITAEEWAAQSHGPIGLYTPHSAPMQLAFYDGEAFPEDYRGDAFVAMRGSWNRLPPSGYEVVRLDFENGEPVGIEPFLSGFVYEDEESPSGWSQMGRLCGLAQGPDGALYLSDDTNGVIYKIAYDGEGAGREAPRMTNAERVTNGLITAAAPDPTPQKVAKLSSEQVKAKGKLQVSSADFSEGGAIDENQAAEGDNASPAVSWEGAPKKTRSFALLMEDPDAPEDAPIIHWVAYDIPADVTSLPEGLSGAPAVEVPAKFYQGANDNGSTGYYGPRPPEGQTHSYHVQVYALDKELGLPHGATRQQVVEAMKGHVLAMGETVGSYTRPAEGQGD